MAEKLGQGKLDPDLVQRLREQKGSIIGSTPEVDIRCVESRREDYGKVFEAKAFHDTTSRTIEGAQWMGGVSVWVVSFAARCKPLDGPDLDIETAILSEIQDYVFDAGDDGMNARGPAKEGYVLQGSRHTWLQDSDEEDAWVIMVEQTWTMG